jgi:Family of unknown function (DUF6882)
MWGWANESILQNVTKAVAKVRAFGAAENIAELKEEELPDDEYLGWGLTAVAAKVLGAKGAYRCPGENGFVYVVYSSVGFVVTDEDKATDSNQVECDDHGSGFEAYVCEHLVSNPEQKWFSNEPDEEDKCRTRGVRIAKLYFKSRVSGTKRTNQKGASGSFAITAMKNCVRGENSL